MKTIKGMDNIGTERIWLKGSRMYVRRSVYQKPNGDGAATFWIVWYGNPIQVRRGNTEYYTVEPY